MITITGTKQERREFVESHDLPFFDNRKADVLFETLYNDLKKETVELTCQCFRENTEYFFRVWLENVDWWFATPLLFDDFKCALAFYWKLRNDNDARRAAVNGEPVPCPRTNYKCDDWKTGACFNGVEK